MKPVYLATSPILSVLSSPSRLPDGEKTDIGFPAVVKKSIQKLTTAIKILSQRRTRYGNMLYRSRVESQTEPN